MAEADSGNGRRLNVLITITGLGIGGAETVVRDLVRGIDRGRFNVSVCCLKALGEIGQELADSGVDIVALPRDDQASFAETPSHRPKKVDYFTSMKLRRLIRRKHVDVVHTHSTHALVDASVVKLTMPSLKVVHTFHFGNYPHKASRELWMEGLSSRVVDRLIAVGEVQRQQIKSVFRLNDRRIGTVWNGVGTAAAEGDRAFRARIGCEDCVLVGTLANLIEQKGLRDLLAVARRLRNARADVRFAVIGEGAMRAELERLRADMGLGDTVVFPGWIPNAAATMLPVFDIYFQPSLWEAMSIAILEAMAAGRPVVATRVGEAPYVIDDGSDGVLVAPGDTEAMAAAITSLAGDVGLRRRLGNAAATKVAGRFTVEHMSRAYERVYLELAGLSEPI